MNNIDPQQIANLIRDRFASYIEEGEGTIEGEKVQDWTTALRDIVAFALSDHPEAIAGVKPLPC